MQLLCYTLLSAPCTAAAPAAAGATATPTAAGTTSAAAAAAQSSQVPSLELAKWNQAYKMYIPLITAQQQAADNIIDMDKCTADGFDADPAAAPLEACYYKQHVNGSFSYWRKKPGGFVCSGSGGCVM